MLDLSIAPDGASDRLRAAINRPVRRSFGLFKLENEFVGLVRAREFEIWERRQHAIHARGRIDARRGGTRISATFVLSGRSRVLLAAFFVLYLLLSLDLASRDPALALPVPPSVVLVAGALVIAAVFAAGAWKQRADLRRFVSRLFADVAGSELGYG